MEPAPRVPSSPWLCREPRVRTPRGGQVLCPHIPQDWFWGGVWAGCRGASRSSQAVAGAAGAWAVGAEPASGGDGGGPLSAERGAAWGAAHGTVGESGSTGPCDFARSGEDAEDSSLLRGKVGPSGERRERACQDGRSSPSGPLGWSAASPARRPSFCGLCATHFLGAGSWGRGDPRPRSPDPVQPCRPQSVSGQSWRPCPEPSMLGPRGQLCGCGSCWGAGKMGAVLGVLPPLAHETARTPGPGWMFTGPPTHREVVGDSGDGRAGAAGPGWPHWAAGPSEPPGGEYVPAVTRVRPGGIWAPPLSARGLGAQTSGAWC